MNIKMMPVFIPAANHLVKPTCLITILEMLPGSPLASDTPERWSTAALAMSATRCTMKLPSVSGVEVCTCVDMWHVCMCVWESVVWV